MVENAKIEAIKGYGYKSSQDSTPVTNPGTPEKKTPVFMVKHDVTTANEEDAKKIGEFLNNRQVRKERRQELQGYLMDNGYTEDVAKKVAKQKVKSEKSQARAKTTVVFTDKAEYEKFKAEQKQNGNLYNATLIKDKQVLEMINGDRFSNPEEKEAQLKKFHKTDEKGDLIKDENGKYIFDSDKYKTEMEQDVTAYRLTLKDRAEAAEERGIKKSDEKNAIKATGLDYRRDNTNLYKGAYFTASAATLIFGGAVAKATAVAGASSSVVANTPHSYVDSDANAKAKATAKSTNRLGQILGATGLAIAGLTIKDRDPKTDKREKAEKVFDKISEKTTPEPAKKPGEEKPECKDCLVVPQPVPVENKKEIPNMIYKMQKGDILAEVIKAKYGITDKKELDQAKKIVRTETGISETGRDKNGNTIIPVITDESGKKFIDAYSLPPEILGHKRIDGKVKPTQYKVGGPAVSGNGKNGKTTKTTIGEEYDLVDGCTEKKIEGTKRYKKLSEAQAAADELNK